jgi:hypothetical protein
MKFLIHCLNILVLFLSMACNRTPEGFTEGEWKLMQVESPAIVEIVKWVESSNSRKLAKNEIIECLKGVPFKAARDQAYAMADVCMRDNLNFEQFSKQVIYDYKRNAFKLKEEESARLVAKEERKMKEWKIEQIEIEHKKLPIDNRIYNGRVQLGTRRSED